MSIENDLRIIKAQYTLINGRLYINLILKYIVKALKTRIILIQNRPAFKVVDNHKIVSDLLI